MEIVKLHPDRDANDIAKALRNIADDIEAGAYDFDPTFAALVLAHESTRITREGEVQSYSWQTHGLGKCSVFSVRGLLATASHKFDGQQ